MFKYPVFKYPVFKYHVFSGNDFSWLSRFFSLIYLAIEWLSGKRIHITKEFFKLVIQLPNIVLIYRNVYIIFCQICRLRITLIILVKESEIVFCYHLQGYKMRVIVFFILRCLPVKADKSSLPCYLTEKGDELVSFPWLLVRSKNRLIHSIYCTYKSQLQICVYLRANHFKLFTINDFSFIFLILVQYIWALKV